MYASSIFSAHYKCVFRGWSRNLASQIGILINTDQENWNNTSGDREKRDECDAIVLVEVTGKHALP